MIREAIELYLEIKAKYGEPMPPDKVGFYA